MPNLRPSPEVSRAFQDLLAAAEARQDGYELVIALLRESVDLVKKRQPLGGALTENQVAFLIESGEFTAEEFAETAASVDRGDLAEEERMTRLGAVTASLSAAEVALRLSVDASGVRRRQAKGNLFSFLVGGKRRYPTWQFTDDATQPVLPGLAAVIKGFPETKHPASIQGFMSTPQESLRVDGVSVTPPQWLLQGGDPQAVVDIVDSFLQS